MRRRPGNKTWLAGGAKIRPAQLTRFEKLALEQNAFTFEQMLKNEALQNFARRNRFSYYVPERLLKFWNLEVQEYEVGTSLREDKCQQAVS